MAGATGAVAPATRPPPVHGVFINERVAQPCWVRGGWSELLYNTLAMGFFWMGGGVGVVRLVQKVVKRWSKVVKHILASKIKDLARWWAKVVKRGQTWSNVVKRWTNGKSGGNLAGLGGANKPKQEEAVGGVGEVSENRPEYHKMF